MSLSEDDGLSAIRREADRAVRDLSTDHMRWSLLETLGKYDDRFWSHCREQGWTGIGVPEEFGGIGAGLAEICVLGEACGAFACGAPFLELNFVVAQAILRHGDDATRSLWLPRLADGAVKGALAVVEGADVLAPQPGLLLEDGRLTGPMRAVPGAGVADLAVTLVTHGEDTALALVDLHQDGVGRALIASFDNSRCTADLEFAQVPAVLLEDRTGIAAASALLDLHAVVVAHQQVGGAVAMLAKARDHALNRHAFGQPIAAFQSVKHRIAQNYVSVELAKASAAEAVDALDGGSFPHAAAAARLLATEAYEGGVRDAIHVHGGIGATWESDLHLHQRRSRTLALELGPLFAWQDLLVDRIVGEHA